MSTLFEHPKKLYRLRLPEGWKHDPDQENKTDDFNYAEREDVAFWLGVVPMRFDFSAHPDRMVESFRNLLKDRGGANPRRDPRVRHFAFAADRVDCDHGGNLWMISVDDLLLIGGTIAPKAEHDAWEPTFLEILNSIEVDRKVDLERIRLADEVCERVNKKWPNEKFVSLNGVVRNATQEIGVENLLREIRAAPKHRDKIIRKYVKGIVPVDRLKTGREEWDEVSQLVFPMLKPRYYTDPGHETESVIRQEWVGDTLLIYGVQLDGAIRHVNTWDMERWKLDVDALHDQAIRNLRLLPWPNRLDGLNQPGGGLMLFIDGGDMFNASRILHPALHDLLSRQIGSPFYAAVPAREALIVFSAKPPLLQAMREMVRMDYEKSPYQISPQIYIVTADGIALAPD